MMGRALLLSQSLTRTYEVATASCRVDYKNMPSLSFGQWCASSECGEAVSTEDQVQALKSLVFVSWVFLLQCRSVTWANVLFPYNSFPVDPGSPVPTITS